MKSKDTNALILGRFQPFHKGHLEVIRSIAKQWESVTIGIGSAQFSHTGENPFTAGERYLMISNALRDDGIANYSILPIVDVNRYGVWVAHVVSMVPPFKAVYTNNALTRRLFSEAGYEVRASPLFNREMFSGTEIRRRIIAGERWKHLVPKATAKVIADVDGIQRMRELSVAGTPLRYADEPAEGSWEDH